LLDTHLLLWWLEGSPRLSVRARELMASPANAIFVSAVSLWEIRLKQSIGKLRVPVLLKDAIAEESFESLPLMPLHADGIADLPWHHRDPFDRILIAQARAEGMTFLTADEALSAYGAFVLVV
jgi:PIN domain nuclease of toxin-antitoxin system